MSHKNSELEDFLHQPIHWLSLRKHWILLLGILLYFVILITLQATQGIILTWPLLLGLLLFFVGAGWAWAKNREMTNRIRHLTHAAQQVARGDMTIKVEDYHQDEFGQLTSAFNQMTSSLSSLQHSRNLLSCTMSPAVRQSLLEHGLDFRGMNKTVSTLFVDIRDFTRLTETHNIEQLIFFLNDYYATIVNQVHIEGGIVGKYGGDSILAFFGAPISKTPAEISVAVLLTALALQETIHDLNERWKYLGMPKIEIGVGITLGPVVAGPIGSERQFEYTVIGDTVNLASRLQDLTRNIEGIGIILSCEVYKALEDKIKQQIRIISLDQFQKAPPHQTMMPLIQFVDLGEVLVKGKKEPVQVYGVPNS